MAKSLLRSVSIALLVLAAPATWADDSAEPPPKNAVGLGWYFIFYHVYASELTGPYTPAGLGLDLKNTNTPYAAYFRRLSTHFQFELAFGVPPLTKAVGKGPATVGSVPFNGVELTTSRWLAPTALIKYNFFGDDSLIRPFIGAGLNVVSFYDRDSTAAGNQVAGGPTRIELSNSFAAAGTVGFTFNLSRRLGAELSYSESRVHSRLRAITDTVVRTSSIDFNPGALVVAAVIKF